MHGLEPFDPWSEWQSVNSSHLNSVRYNGVEKIMEVLFVNGKTYRVMDVESSTWQNLLHSPSPGKFYYHAIRQFGYNIVGPL